MRLHSSTAKAVVRDCSRSCVAVRGTGNSFTVRDAHLIAVWHCHSQHADYARRARSHRHRYIATRMFAPIPSRAIIVTQSQSHGLGLINLPPAQNVYFTIPRMVPNNNHACQAPSCRCSHVQTCTCTTHTPMRAQGRMLTPSRTLTHTPSSALTHTHMHMHALVHILGAQSQTRSS